MNDQTLLGVSGTGNGTGELDLDIRMVPGVPWTVCEALIVDGYSKKWNEHLDKLLNNYNPFGLPVLYLLTYVDCDQDKFGGIWKKYQKHIREDQPAGFGIDPASVQTDLFQRYDSTRAACCNYRKGGYALTVYHIFVRMGK